MFNKEPENMNVKIAVIDDGVNEKIYNTNVLQDNIEIDASLNIHERKGYNPFIPSHGSICAAIIGKYAPDAAIGSIKILSGDNKDAAAGQLAKALEWCCESGYRIANLSLGTTHFRDFESIGKAVQYACAKGLIIVASCINKNVVTCPASLPAVIGVKCDATLTLQDGSFYFNEPAYDGIDITAYCCRSLSNRSGETDYIPLCNSYATPLISALAYNIIMRSPLLSLSEVKNLLKKYGEAGPSCNNLCNKSRIDIPIVLISDYSAAQRQRIEENLVSRFREDGYNAVSIKNGNGAPDICRGYVKADFQDAAASELIRLINKVYDPDIIIIYTNVHKDPGKFLFDLLNSSDIDIRVVISERYDMAADCLNEVNTGNNILLLPYGGTFGRIKNIKVLDSMEADFEARIYGHIMELFDR